MIVALARDESNVPASGEELMIWSGPFSEIMTMVATVPGGMSRASIIAVAGPAFRKETSGRLKLPVASDAMEISSIEITRICGWRVGRKRP